MDSQGEKAHRTRLDIFARAADTAGIKTDLEFAVRSPRPKSSGFAFYGPGWLIRLSNYSAHDVPPPENSSPVTWRFAAGFLGLNT